MSFADFFQAPRNRRYSTTTQQATLGQADELRARSLSERLQMESGFDMIGTDTSLRESSDAARQYATGMFDAQMGTVHRQNRALGGLSDRQAMAQDKRAGMRRSLTEAAMGNRAIIGEMQMGQMVDDYAYTQRDMYDEASLGMMDASSNIENNHNAERKIRRARRSASKLGALGTIAGIGLAAATGGAGAAALTAFGSAR